MVQPDEITGFVQAKWLGGFSQVGSWIGAIFLVICIMVLFYFIYIFLQYKVKVTYFPVMADTKSNEVTLGAPKKDRGKRVKYKGIEVFKLLFARKTLKDIPFKLEYPDGIFLLRKSRDEFEPIKRPSLGNPSVVVQTADNSLQLWAQLRAQQVRKRFVDEDLAKKQLYIFVGVIIACLIFAGIVIWMSYATQNAAMGRIDQMLGPLNQIAEKIGLGGP